MTASASPAAPEDGFLDLVNAEIHSRGWSPARLSREAGLEKSGVTRLLHGTRPPTIRAVVAIGTRFGLEEGTQDVWVARLARAADTMRNESRPTRVWVEDVGLSRIVCRKLRGGGIRTLRQLCRCTQVEVAALVGVKACRAVERALKRIGEGLKPSLPPSLEES